MVNECRILSGSEKRLGKDVIGENQREIIFS